MLENPRRGRQARNFTTNVPKILDLKSSSEQIFSENCRRVPLKDQRRRLFRLTARWGKRGEGGGWRERWHLRLSSFNQLRECKATRTLKAMSERKLCSPDKVFFTFFTTFFFLLSKKTSEQREAKRWSVVTSRTTPVKRILKLSACEVA